MRSVWHNFILMGPCIILVTTYFFLNSQNLSKYLKTCSEIRFSGMGFWYLPFFPVENHIVAHQILCHLSYPPYKCETALYSFPMSQMLFFLLDFFHNIWAFFFILCQHSLAFSCVVQKKQFHFKIVVLNQGCFCQPRGHLTMSEDIFGCHN